MSDEEVIKRRLLIDGDGTGDDRRLNVLLKLIMKYASSSDDSPTENQLLYDRILCQLSQCEYSVKKSQLLAKTTTKQFEKYKELHSQIEGQIAKTKETIDKSKEDLVNAKTWKHNQMMYDLLAQSINEQPARKETNNMLSNLQAQLRELNEENKALEQKLDIRRKQFHVLVSSANQLRALLEETNNETQFTTSSLDDITNSPGPEPMSE